MSDDLVKQLHNLHKQATVERSHFYVGRCVAQAIDRIEELESKLALSEGALDVASRSWGECQRILEQTEAKLSKSEALLAKALDALDEAVYFLDMGKSAGVYRIVTTLAKLKGGTND